MAYTNPTTASDLSALGSGVLAMLVKHGGAWAPHPIFQDVGIVEVGRGSTAVGARRLADYSAAVNFTENAAFTDVDLPTLTSVNGTLAGRGFSLAISSFAYNAVPKDQWDQFIKLLDQKVRRVIFDDVAYGTNSILATTSAASSISRDSLSNLTIASWMDAVDGVAASGRVRTNAYVDGVGVRGIAEDFMANGVAYGASAATMRLVEQLLVKGGFENINGDTGIEFYGSRLYCSNGVANYYTSGGNTYGVVVPDLSTQPDVQPPLVYMGRADPCALIPASREPNPKWDSIGPIGIGRWLDLSEPVDGFKADFGLVGDAILANDNIRTMQYSTTLVS